jgi:flagellar biosynthesis protein FliP
MKITAIFLFISACFITNIYAQDSSKALAENAYDRKNWQNAETYFKQYLTTNTADTLAIYHLAMAQLKQ